MPVKNLQQLSRTQFDSLTIVPLGPAFNRYFYGSPDSRFAIEISGYVLGTNTIAFFTIVDAATKLHNLAIDDPNLGKLKAVLESSGATPTPPSNQVGYFTIETDSAQSWSLEYSVDRGATSPNHTGRWVFVKSSAVTPKKTPTKKGAIRKGGTESKSARRAKAKPGKPKKGKKSSGMTSTKKGSKKK